MIPSPAGPPRFPSRLADRPAVFLMRMLPSKHSFLIVRPNPILDLHGPFAGPDQ